MQLHLQHSFFKHQQNKQHEKLRNNNEKVEYFLIILIFCVVFSISSVAASDLNDTSIATNMENNQDLQDTALQSYDKSLEDKYAETYKEPTKVTVKTIAGKEKSKANVKVNVKTSSNTPAAGVKVKLSFFNIYFMK